MNQVSSPRLLLRLVIVIVAIGAIWGGLRRDPWDPDETRYLQIASEMVAEGNWALPTFSGEAYTDKPSPFFWILALPVAMVGPKSALVGLLPALLAFLVLPTLVLSLARAVGLGNAAEEWSAVICASSLLVGFLAAGCRMDLLFALAVTAAMRDLVVIIGVDDEPSTRWRLWLWLGLAISFKGPLALAFVFLPLALLGRAVAWRKLFFHWGPLVMPAVIASWLIPAMLVATPQLLTELLSEQVVGRMVESFAHVEPWWYHLSMLPVVFMPWAPLWVVAVIAAWRGRADLSIELRYLHLVAPIGLVFLSLLSSKTFLYPLPLLPAASIALAWWLQQIEEPTRLKWLVSLACALPIVIGLATIVAVSPRSDIDLAPERAAILALSLILPATIALRRNLQTSPFQALRAMALISPLFLALGIGMLIRPFDAMLSLRPFAEAWHRAAPEQQIGLSWDRLQPGFVLFSGRQFAIIETMAELDGALDRGQRVAMNIKAFRSFALPRQQRLAVLETVPYRHTEWLIVADRSRLLDTEDPPSD